MSYSTRTTCRACGSSELIELFSLGEQHVSGFPQPAVINSPHAMSARALESGAVEEDQTDHGPKVPITLQLCRGCTLVQAKHAPAQDMYSGHYWYTSGRNQTMRDALADVARAVQERVPLKPGDVVLDIGSNDGTLLNCFDEGLVRIGVEPASNFKDCYETGVNKPILIPDFWPLHPTALGNRKAKVITALGMFYDLEDANPFVKAVADVLAPDGVFVAQLMCLKQTVQMRDVGNLAHEHLEFYSLRSLMTLLNKHGLVLFDVEENGVNGGSYRLWIMKPEGPYKVEAHRIGACLHSEATLDRPDTYSLLFEEMESGMLKLRTFLKRAKINGKSVYGYGASTKGNVMLQYWNMDSSWIQAIADRSPEKVGRVTAGTGIPIISEEQFRQDRPDYAVVFPYSFIDEFVKREGQWRWQGGKFLVPLPEPYILHTEGGQLRKEML